MSLSVIFNQNDLPSLLQLHFFSHDVFTGAKARQPVSHMRLQDQTTSIQLFNPNKWHPKFSSTVQVPA